MKHKVRVIGKVRTTHCEEDVDDEDIVTTWSKTTCHHCKVWRLQEMCGRNHPIDRKRINAQGRVICMDCVNIATHKYRASIRR